VTAANLPRQRSRAGKRPQPIPGEAVYRFGAHREDVALFGLTQKDLAIIAFEDGRLEVVELHRLTIQRQVPS
jgi:hypothetical protein